MRESLFKVYIKVQGLKDGLVKNQSGQDLIEYALVASLIALAATASMGTVAKTINNAFVNIGSHFATYTS